jgi:hypothetical protein
MADLGTDIGGVMDLDPSLAPVSGRRALIEAVARRLVTPRGALWYDASYGYDLRQFLNGIAAAPSQIVAGVVEQAEADERVVGAQASATFINNTLVVKLALLDGSGPFAFTLKVSQVTVELLTQG